MEYFVKWVGCSARYNTWEPIQNLGGCDELRLEFEQKRAIKILAIENVNNALAYLVQFRDQNEPSFVNHLEARIWSSLIFDFLVDKIKFEGFVQGAASAPTNMLNRATDPHGTPEIVYVTDMLDGLNFCLKYSNGFKFEMASNVKADFAEIAVAFMEQHVKIE